MVFAGFFTFGNNDMLHACDDTYAYSGYLYSNSLYERKIRVS